MINNLRESPSVWDKFERKYITCYTKYQDRYDLMKREFSRIGMKGIEAIWDFPSSYRDVLLRHVPMTNFCSRRNLFFIGQTNYRAIATAYYLGAKSVLIMQDDIRFLKDTGLLCEIIESLPCDFDLAMLNHMKPSNMTLAEYSNLFRQPRINNHWVRFKELTSSGCYAMSRKGMERYMKAYEAPVLTPGESILYHDDYYYQTRFMGEDANMYVAVPVPTIQTPCGTSGAHSDLTPYLLRNDIIGIHAQDYAPFNGNLINIQTSNTKVGDEIETLYSLVDRKEVQAKLPSDLSALSGTISGKLYPDLISASCPNANVTNNWVMPSKATYIWGHTTSSNQLRSAQIQRIPIILCEDGFIRSLDTWCNKTATARDNRSVSLMMDDKGYYFDAARSNRLIEMLDDNSLTVSDNERAHARKLISLIVDNKITKYNHQPLFIKYTIGRHGRRKVLVIDQSYGDFSIRRGGANEQTFKDMLNDARLQNPDCDVLVKTHPDAIAPGTPRKGYYQGLVQKENIFPITFPCNPYSLMEFVDQVYVCSSQFGLEALMAGKKVHVYGRPFYAGWGLTYDIHDFSKVRHRTRTLEELIYLTYCKYIIWNNPDTNKRCSVEESIDWIIKNRRCK